MTDIEGSWTLSFLSSWEEEKRGRPLRPAARSLHQRHPGFNSSLDLWRDHPLLAHTPQGFASSSGAITPALGPGQGNAEMAPLTPAPRMQGDITLPSSQLLAQGYGSLVGAREETKGTSAPGEGQAFHPQTGQSKG